MKSLTQEDPLEQDKVMFKIISKVKCFIFRARVAIDVTEAASPLTLFQTLES